MPNLFTLLILSASTLDVGAAASAPGELKCGIREGEHPGMPEAIVMIDGEVVAHSLEHFNQKKYDIDHFEMICWQWAERMGIRVRRVVFYVQTPQWAAKMTRIRLENLETLITEQDRHVAEHGVYAARAEELASYAPPAPFDVHMRRTSDGWSARLQTGRDWSQFVGNDILETVCYAFAGSPPPEWKPTRPPDGLEFAEREPICFQPLSSFSEGKEVRGG